MAMTAQDLKLDYYKFYDAGNQSAGSVVALKGQFDKGPEKTQLTYLNLFANPASKNGEPMYEKHAHFTWYDLYDPVPDPTRLVTYENQFGKQQLYTGRSYALLAPAEKRELGSSHPIELDHYKVYQVLRGEPLNKAVKVEDQFGSGEARIVDPVFFAVPVQKWHDGATAEINNEKAHLVIYRIYPESANKAIVTRDQFSPRQIHLSRSLLLGAPGVKLDWKEV